MSGREFRELIQAQVKWYRAHGKYPEQRISRTREGDEYVIGDWSWNRTQKHNPERIEGRMSAALPPPPGDEQ